MLDLQANGSKLALRDVPDGSVQQSPLVMLLGLDDGVYPADFSLARRNAMIDFAFPSGLGRALQRLLQGRSVLFVHPADQVVVLRGCRRRLQAEDPVSFL